MIGALSKKIYFLSMKKLLKRALKKLLTLKGIYKKIYNFVFALQYTSIVIRYLIFEMFLCESWGKVSNMQIIYILVFQLVQSKTLIGRGPFIYIPSHQSLATHKRS